MFFSKHILNNYLLKLLLLSLLASTAFAYSGGTGEPNTPYQIGTVSDWQQLMSNPNDWDKHFIMIANLNLRGVTLIPVGNSSRSFKGVFNGNGYIIRNIVINMPGSNYVGLFGYVNRQSAEIKNLILIAPDVNSGTGSYTGSLAGYAEKGTINNCGVFWGSVSGNSFVGGLVGSCSANVSQSCFEGDVSGLSCSGGLIGAISTGDNFSQTPLIESCYSKGSVKGDRFIGGLVGCIAGRSTGTIYNCYSQSSVSGTSFVGGLVGEQEAGLICCSYSSGQVTGTDSIGGFIGGYGDPRLVFYCYWDTQSSGQSQSGAGQGKTTQEMHSISTFLSWGCDGQWTIDNGNDYPRLVWEGFSGQLIPIPAYGGGSGTADDPFLIYTPQQLNTVGFSFCHMSMHFKLMADIDLSDYTGTQFNVIGNREFPFMGMFDGNGKKILNFSYKVDANSWRDSTGLFGWLDGAEVKNVGLIEPNVVALYGYDTGALIGVSVNSNIINCYVVNGIVKGDGTVGGLVGSSCPQFEPGDIGSQIEDCWTSCYVEGSDCVGGLVGQNCSRIFDSYSTSVVRGKYNIGGLAGFSDYGVISRCFAKGEVTGENTVGGLVGWSDYNADIYDSYATGNVSASVNTAGGLVGFITRGKFFRCYATGNVDCPQNVGGFIGDIYYSGDFYGCFWNKTVNPSLNGSGSTTPAPNGIMGKTTIELQTQETFTSAGWDFSYTDGEAVWYMPIDEYPILPWQISPADIYTDGKNNFRDFAVFAKYWMRDDCRRYNSYCDWADLNFDGSVDIDDLIEFMNYWLQSGIYE